MPQDRHQPTSRWVLLGIVLGLCALTLNPAQATTMSLRDNDATFITAATPGILDIEGGECFSDPTYSAAAGGEIVLYTPCPQQADNQSYGFVHAADGPWDAAALTRFALAGCERGFRHYWPTAGSTLDFYPIMPTAESWADGDRDVMCVVYNPRGRLTDSVLPS